MSVTKLLAAALLVVSPATFGLAAYTGALDLSSPEAPETFGGNVIAEWEQELPETLATGELDLRIDRGAVRVIGWDRAAYHVMVLEAPHEDSQLSNAEVTAEFTDNTQGDHLNLSLVVDKEGTYSASVDGTNARIGGDPVERAIVAYVPASASYDRLFACSGQRPALINTVDQLTGDTVRIGSQHDECVAQEATAGAVGTVRVDPDGQEREHLNVTFGLEGLTGTEAVLDAHFADMGIDQVELDKLWVDSDYGDLDINASTFDEADLSLDYGDLSMHAQAKTLSIDVDYGDVDVIGLDAEAADIEADYGDVDLTGDVAELDVDVDYGDVIVIGDVGQATYSIDYGDLTHEGALDEASVDVDHGDVSMVLDPRASGTIEVEADYGDILVQVPARDAIGYAVDAQTDHGRVKVALEDAQVSSDQEDDDQEEHVVARTNGFDERPVKVRLGLEADHGDISVTDGSEPVEPEEEEDEDHPEEPSDPSSLPKVLQ